MTRSKKRTGKPCSTRMVIPIAHYNSLAQSSRAAILNNLHGIGHVLTGDGLAMGNALKIDKQ